MAFIDELSTAMHFLGKVLTVSIPPIYDTGRTGDSGYWVYDYAAIGEHVDRIRIMAYDYSTDRPGPIAPLAWVRSTVKAAKKAVDDDSKIVLGVPMYGRNWVVGTPAPARRGSTPPAWRSWPGRRSCDRTRRARSRPT